MQVVMADSDLRTFQRTARQKGLTLAEWVRQVLRRAVRDEPLGATEKKLATVRAACRHAYPAPDVADMLAEIERGYVVETGE